MSNERRLHIGGTVQAEGWEVFNAIADWYVDHVGDAADLRRFEDGTFTALYASHILEHFDYLQELPEVLREWFRVIKKGGTIYISVPNLEVLAYLFLQKEHLSSQERYDIMRMIFGGHITPYDYHKVGFNQEILVDVLLQAGFHDLQVCQDFGFFQDTSLVTVRGIPISLNMVAHKG